MENTEVTEVKEFSITVRIPFLLKEKVEFSIKATDSVEQVMEKVMQKHDLRMEIYDFCLHFEGKLLKLGTSMWEYQLGDQSLITICICLHSKPNFDDTIKDRFVITGKCGIDKAIILKHNGKPVLEYKDSTIILANIIKQLQQEKRRVPEISELRLICEQKIEIDTDIRQTIWHGVNIVIVAEVIHVSKENCSINVSGNQGEEFKTNAVDGTEPGDDGMPGMHGTPGESGGNVLICCSEVYGYLLEILSFGGDGGCGQNGGNGMNGQNGDNGTTLSMSDFKEKFPPIAKLSGNSCRQSIRSTLYQLEGFVTKTCWCDGNDLQNWQDLLPLLKRENRVDLYLQGTTASGNEITISYYFSICLPKRHSFILYKGSKGKPGQIGGKGGRGGDGGNGGYKGDITILSLEGEPLETSILIRRRMDGGTGVRGYDGEGGGNGKPGKNAGDLGYVDWWTLSEPYYYNREKLKIRTRESEGEYSVWCGKLKQYVDIVDGIPEQYSYQLSRNENIRWQTGNQRKAFPLRKDNVKFNMFRIEANQTMEAKQQFVSLQKSSVVRRLVGNSEYEMVDIKKPATAFKLFNKQQTNTKSHCVLLPNDMDLSLELEFDLRYEGISTCDKLKDIDKKSILHCFEKLTVVDDTNSVIHCIFGEPNSLDEQLLCEHADKRRNELVKHTSNQDSILSVALKCAILRFIHVTHSHRDSIIECEKLIYECLILQDDIEKATKLKMSKFTLMYLPLHLTDSLTLFQCRLTKEVQLQVDKVYQILSTMPWDQLRNEYADYLAHPDTVLGLAELNLIAEIRQIQICVFIESDVIHPILLNRNGDEKYYVLIAEDGNINRLKLNEEMLDLELHRQMRRQKLHDMIIKKHIKEPSISGSFEDVSKRLEFFFPTMSALVQVLDPFNGTFHGLAEIVLKHLYERIQVTNVEFEYIMNFVVMELLNDRRGGTEDLYLIFLLYPHYTWFTELLILAIENALWQKLDFCSEIRELIQSICDINILLLFGNHLRSPELAQGLTEECVLHILRVLTSIVEYDNDELNSLNCQPLNIWPIELRGQYWSNKLRKLSSATSESLNTDAIRVCVYYFLEFENEVGIESAETYFDVLIHNRFSVTQCLKGFSTCTENYQKLLEMGEHAHTRSASYICEAIKRDGNTSPNIHKLVDTLSFMSIESDFSSHMTIEDIHSWAQQSKMLKLKLTDDIYQYIEIFRVAVSLLSKGEICLRHTQIIAVEILQRNGRNTLAQISTGEGKTLIITAVAIARALAGEKVDILTSNAILARRDATKSFPIGMSELYKVFGVTVHHNCSENEECRIDSYTKDVVYGEISFFQRDFLFSTFYDRNITGSRSPDNIIVDEVDCMLLDRGNNVLYLSHNVPGLDGLESLYIFIWQLIVNGECDIDNILNSVLYDLYGTVQREDMRKLGKHLTDQECGTLYVCLLRNDVLGSGGRLSPSFQSKLNELHLPNGLDKFKDRVAFILKGVDERSRFIDIPQFLYGFTDLHLRQWIKSALYAAFVMVENRDYIVGPDPTKQSMDLGSQVIIIDQNTGTDLASSHWDSAVHQFLQLKHKCKLTPQSLKTVFISNISFIKRYSRVYGLSGTLGSPTERNFLRDTFDVDYVTIPTASDRLLKQLAPLLAFNEEKWLQFIVDEARQITVEQQRSILFICATIDHANKIFDSLRSCNDFQLDQLSSYERDYDVFKYGSSETLPPRKIIVATNLAGRGTDIKMSKDLLDAGGLHVCLTFLPNSLRVEQQAFGRTARKGEPGTCRLIFMDQSDSSISSNAVLMKKMNRNKTESLRLNELGVFYKDSICVEENIFLKFTVHFREMCRTCDRKGIAVEVKELVCASILDYWALLLDRLDYKQEELHRKMSKVLRTYFEDVSMCLDRLAERMDDAIFDFAKLIQSPSRLIELGKLYFETNPGISISGLDRVDDPFFFAVSNYYKAAAIVKESHLSNEKNKFFFLETLITAKEAFEKQSVKQNTYSSIVASCTLHEQLTITDGYREQKMNNCMLIDIFLNSISDITGRWCMPNGFENDSDIPSETNSEDMFRQLMNKGYISSASLNNENHTRFSRLCTEYAVDEKLIRGKLTAAFKDRHEVEILSCIQKAFGELDCWKSRQKFWNLAVHTGLFTDVVECVIVVDNAQLQNDQRHILQSLGCMIDQCDVDNTMKQHVKKLSDVFNNQTIVMAAPIEVGEEFHIIIKSDNSLKLLSQLTKYNFNFIQFAAIDEQKVRHSPFCIELCRETFARYDIPQSDWDGIWKILIENKCIVESADGRIDLGEQNLSEVSISTLGEFELYRDAVDCAMRNASVYERVRLNLLADMNNKKNVCTLTALQDSLHISFTMDMIDENILHYPKIIKMYNEKDFAKDKRKSMSQYIERHRSQILGLETIDVSFKTLREYLQLTSDRNIASEIHSFSVDSLDRIFSLKDQDYSWATIAKASIILAFGVGQLVLGVYIELKSAGFMTHVASGLMSEGISDILFGLSALYSGKKFTWSDYAKHKAVSVGCTIVTTATAAFLARHVKFFKYGYKTFGPSYAIKVDGVIKKMSENVIELSAKTMCRQVVKKSISKIASCSASALLNMVIESFITKYLKSFCCELGAKLRQQLDRLSERTELERIMHIYVHAKETMKKSLPDMDKLFEIVFNKSQFRMLLNSWMGWIKNFGSAVVNGVKQACNKMSTSGIIGNGLETMTKLFEIFVTAKQISDFVKSLVDAGSHAGILKNLLLSEMQKCDITTMGNISDNEGTKNTVKLMCQTFDQRVNEDCTILVKNITTVIFQSVGQYALEETKQLAKSTFARFRENQYRKEFDKLKDCASKGFNDRQEQKEHDDKLLELMRKTKNPILFAAIVRKGVPMDRMCADALSKIVSSWLGKTIIFQITTAEGYTHLGQTNSNGSHIIIEIPLVMADKNKVGHYGADSDDGNDNNDCLLAFAKKQLPELSNVSNEMLRNHIADLIETDKQLSQSIEMGMHSVTIQQGFIGARNRRIVDDIPPADKVGTYEDVSQLSKRMEQVADHILPKQVAKALGFDDGKLLPAMLVHSELHQKFPTTAKVSKSFVNTLNELVEDGKFADALKLNLRMAMEYYSRDDLIERLVNEKKEKTKELVSDTLIGFLNEPVTNNELRESIIKNRRNIFKMADRLLFEWTEIKNPKTAKQMLSNEEAIKIRKDLEKYIPILPSDKGQKPISRHQSEESWKKNYL